MPFQLDVRVPFQLDFRGNLRVHLELVFRVNFQLGIRVNLQLDLRVTSAYGGGLRRRAVLPLRLDLTRSIPLPGNLRRGDVGFTV